MFFHNSEPSKPIDCIRVDGAADGGPSHEEAQFWWTARHTDQQKIATLITTQNSGSSYLNHVELQNGCLAHVHSNTYIPSTLAGSCMDPTTGKIDEEKLKQNLSLAIDAYIHCVVVKIPSTHTKDHYQLKCTKLPAFLKV